MNFQEFTEHVESRIGEHNQVGVWDSEITEITEIGYNFLKCLITFRKEDFTGTSDGQVAKWSQTNSRWELS